MKISYLVTCSTESDTLDRLLSLLISYTDNLNEVVVLYDISKKNDVTTNIISKYISEHVKLVEYNLNNDYGSFKNYGITQCSGDWIYQLDGDELPSEYLLGDNLVELINSNQSIEAYAFPRINDFKGVTDVHAKQWGWRLTTSPTLNRPLVNYPDYQFRLYKRDPDRINYKRRLHEKIEGYKNFALIPAEDESLAIYHDKTIERQVETNLRYNALFTETENKGHKIL